MTDRTTVNTPVSTPLLLTNPSLSVVRPSVLMTTPLVVASLGLPGLLNNGLHARMDGILLRSQMSTSSPSAKAVTLATNVRTSLPTPEPDTTDKVV
jgi:hypothetical protein